MPPRTQPLKPPTAPSKVAKPKPKPWGLPQLLAVVVGGYAGLVAYGAWAGGTPNPMEAVPPDPRTALFVRDLKAERSPDGLLLIRGTVTNRAKAPLKRASFAVRLRDASGKLLTTVHATVGEIPEGGSAPLEAKASAIGAQDLEVEAELAHFGPASR